MLTSDSLELWVTQPKKNKKKKTKRCIQSTQIPPHSHFAVCQFGNNDIPNVKSDLLYIQTLSITPGHDPGATTENI